jgi:hypothetical protein
MTYDTWKTTEPEPYYDEGFVDQEAEHWAHEAGCASELQNAFSESQIAFAMQQDDKKRIIALQAAGKFVVVEEGIVYCRVTDAIVGSRRHVADVHDTREAAEAQLATLSQYDGEWGYYLAAPFQPQEVRYYSDEDSCERDEIPF